MADPKKQQPQSNDEWQDVSGDEWADVPPTSTAPNAGLAPPATSKMLPAYGPEGIEGSNPEIPHGYSGPGAWPMARPVQGKDLIPGAIVGGAAALAAAPTVAGVMLPPLARFAVKHPIISNVLASGAINAARHIPYVGKMVPPMAEVLPWLRGQAGGAIEKEAAATPKMSPLASESEVTVVPEPRPLFKGEEPNYMGSVPREELGKMAMGRKPGAARQMQQLGQPIIYAPAEADIPPPRR